MKKPNILGIIPARYDSTRFPGKPLALILGKTLVQRTYENALRAKILDQVLVATDDQRIYEHVHAFVGKVVMTSPTCPTGTDRLAEVIRDNVEFSSASIVINIQGDEPTLDPHIIQVVVETLQNDPKADLSTAIIPIKSEQEALNPSTTKCVIDKNSYALYFSRGLIPAGRGLKYKPHFTYFKHLGIYGYRREFLLHYAELAATPLQLEEDLEQLKVLEHGFRIKTVRVENEAMDVNDPEDIKKVEQLICKQNLFS